ncbi:MAG TPA: outer membrane protein assembly factor BamA [Terracidiphilus sp.]|nr:outer membrane protein assembly factor BamA [Terracidiphilus sp.]
MQFGINALPLAAAVLLLWVAAHPASGQSNGETGGPGQQISVAESAAILTQQPQQTPPALARGRRARRNTAENPEPAIPVPTPYASWEGKTVRSISIEGVAEDWLKPLPGNLPQKTNAPLSRDNVTASLRKLFATGLFETIEAEVRADGDEVDLIFHGAPRTFIGTVAVTGAKGATLNTQLERAARLNPGTRFTESRLNNALEQMKQTMADNGFHEPTITCERTPHPKEQLVDLLFTVKNGPQARVGTVDVTGDAGMSVSEFKRHAHLHTGKKVDHDTTSRALSGVLKYYQKHDRLEAEIKQEAADYVPSNDHTNYRFSANRGPKVQVRVEGAKIGGERLKRLVPVYEEGTVDDDLLNEGNRRLRDYFQRLGYFDVKVEHRRETQQANDVVIVYTVTLGTRRKVGAVKVEGNHYFDSATLEQLLSVHSADVIDRHGAYSQALVSSDVDALRAVYQNNGFSTIKVTPEISTGDSSAQGSKGKSSKKSAPLNVTYHIDEGEQQRVGALTIDGNNNVPDDQLQLLMNTAVGQLFSPQNLAGDRDAILTDYLSKGFDQAQVTVDQQPEKNDPSKVDVTFHIVEGKQIFVRKVLITGLHYTRPDTVARAITLQAGDPLSQSALQQMQRNLYDFSLFNEVDTAVENPTGNETYKTILVQMQEARRWTLTYGLGFEAQTGSPQNNNSPNGSAGISPRVLLDVTRNNLFGREQSASAQGTYGLLEQRINLLFQNPHFHGNQNFGLTISAGYANSRDVTTYVSSKLEGGMRWAEHFNTPGSFLSKANTFVYEANFRRVKVARDSLQVGPNALDILSAAVRVAGPAFTWIHDTRDSALDAHRGSYWSFQEFLSTGKLGAEAQFNRLDMSYSSFYSFNKGRFVLARNTRYGQERAYGAPENELIPLPERLYAGGSTSLRGFSINAAGPRDVYTGYPIGGAGALVNNIELRLPPPMLPFFGQQLSFVLFHDMGNIFANAGDIWRSTLRFHQPDRDACKDLTQPDPSGPWNSTGEKSACSFNYFSHAIGMGLRYHTPVGPIRLDFSYNLNPPIYPVTYNYSKTPQELDNPYVGSASHFNFFFSLGQTF